MPSIRDFSGGVLNQELQNLDTGNGILFDCKNVLSSWNGELRKRTGTRWLQNLTGNSKIIPYRLPNGDDMIMLLRDKVIKCYKFDDNDNLTPYQIYTGGSSMNFPTTGWSSNTNGNWTVSANGTTPAYNGINPNYIETEFYYTDETINSLSVYYGFQNTSPFVLSSLTFTWERTNFAAQGGPNIRTGDDPIIQYSDDGINWTPVETSFSKDVTTSYGDTYLLETWSTHVVFNITNNSHFQEHRFWRVGFADVFVYGSGTNYFSRYAYISNVNCITMPSFSDLVFNNCPYENEDFDNIRFCQNDKTLTMACKGKPPYQITNTLGVFSDSLFVPSDYSGIWTAVGYPACVTYYQNRLWFGGFEIKPTRVYASEFGKFNNFAIPSPIVSTSPIIADGTEISNVIENMWGGNNALYCMSEDGISMIDAQGAIVATDQVEFKLRNREPVNAMVPTVKDDIMMYLGADKQKILITDYDFVVQRFKANCISDKYNDFLHDKVKELHYIPRRSSLIYGVLETGKWFVLLFDIDKGKNALFPCESSGEVIDVQPIKYKDQIKLLMLTQLPSYQYVLEEKLPQADQKIMDFMSAQEQQEYTKDVIDSDIAYLDHSVKFVFDQPTYVVSGLPYIQGEKVEVIADGQYLGTKTVLINTDTGQTYIELDMPFTKIVLGYKYDSYAVLKFITPYTERKFPKEIAVNFINTGYLEVGNTFDSLKSVLNNLVESVSISGKKILMNGNYAKTLDKHSFETPYVIVRSDKGLPFIITGMDYKVDMSNYQGGV